MDMDQTPSLELGRLHIRQAEAALTDTPGPFDEAQCSLRRPLPQNCYVGVPEDRTRIVETPSTDRLAEERVVLVVVDEALHAVSVDTANLEGPAVRPMAG